MAISNAQRAKINKMNKASQTVSLGTIVQGLQTDTVTLKAQASTLTGVNLLSSGSFSSGSVEATGSSISILTGTTAIKGAFVNVRRSGSHMYNVNVDISAGSKLVIKSAGSPIASGDVVDWIVY
jgi:hypothetical protein